MGKAKNHVNGPPMTLGNMRELRLHDLSALASTTG